MNIAQHSGIATMLFALLGTPAFAQQSYLNTEGRLAQELTIEVTETGGFVGVQSYAFVIRQDGSFIRRYAINNGPVRDMSGRLHPEALAALARTLEQNRLAELPARIVGLERPAPGGADIPTIQVKMIWGQREISAHFVMGAEVSRPVDQQLAAVNQILSAVRNLTDAR